MISAVDRRRDLPLRAARVGDLEARWGAGLLAAGAVCAVGGAIGGRVAPPEDAHAGIFMLVGGVSAAAAGAGLLILALSLRLPAPLRWAGHVAAGLAVAY